MKFENLETLEKNNRNYLLQPASSISALLEQGPSIICSAKGNRIADAQGKELLDAVGGLWCVNVGYGREEISEVMATASKELAYYHTFTNCSNPWQIELAEKLVQISPKGLDKVFFGNGGSDANDTLIKIAWHYHTLKGQPTKKKIIARERAYHGTSISTASLTGLKVFHNEYPLPLDFVLRTDCPHYYSEALEGESESDFCDRLISNVKDLIEKEGAENIAAFFAEPVFAAGGVIEPPKDYFKKLKALLKQNNILLAVDEVVCGYGRLGTWFGSEQFDIEPDMMSSAKGLTSGYFPMSAAFISNSIWDILKDGSDKVGAFYHGYTYSGHPVGCAVALANLKIIEREGLLEAARVNGDYMHDGLADTLLNLPHVGQVRGRGLLAGIQLVKDKVTKELPNASLKWPMKVTQAARAKGLIVRPLASFATLAISPPLTFTKQDIDITIDVLSSSIKQVTNETK